MAISFKKEVILEAIKAVLAEATLEVTTSDGTEASASPAQKEQIKDARAKGTSVVFKKTGETKPALEEDDHLNPNDESDMAKTQLYATAKYAIELLRMIQDGEQLDAWVQAKITKAADYIDAVKHYMEGEEYLASTDAPVDAPVNEAMDINDPIMMKLRAAKMKTYKTEPQTAPKANTNDSKLAALEKYRAQVMRDMEQEAEPEGGPIADKYGAELNKIDKAIAKLSGHGEWGPEAENPYMSKAEIERRAAMMEDEPVEEPVDEKMDPVGQEDDDINNDGKVDKTDKYLKNRRISISKAITQAKKK